MIIYKPKAGTGIFNTLLKPIAKSGLKAIINSRVTHKLSNAVLDGAASAVETSVRNAIKRKASPPPSQNKKLVIDINHIIDGSGIVLD